MGPPLAIALNVTEVCSKRDFRPLCRRNSESVQDKAKVTISH